MALREMQGVVDAQLQVALQTSLFGTAPLRCATITQPFHSLDRSSQVLFEPGWLQGSDQLFEQLRDEMPWRAMKRPMYDRIVAVPRLICGITPATLPASHALVTITNELEAALGSRFDEIGLNYYRDGNDSVAWHGDRVGRSHWHETTVVLVSLGSARTLQLRRAPATRRPTTPVDTLATPTTRRRWQLGHGDLFVMRGACQRDWQHCVPKESGVGPRISLALRSKEAGGGPRMAPAGVPPLGASRKLQ